MNRISIALCTWNGEKYLEEQLRSILAQTRLPDELVLGDDASSDGTLALAHRLLAHAPFDVKIVSHAQNLGSTANFEATLDACSGDVIFPCDQDDVWHPSKIATCCNVLETSGSSWLFHDADLIDASGNPIGKSHWQELGIHLSHSCTIEIRSLLKRPYATGCCMAIRRDALRRTMPFGRRWIHDEWISSFLAANGLNGVPLSSRLVSYRIHPSQQVGTRASGLQGRLRRIMAADSAAYALEAMKNLELETALILSNSPESTIQLVADKRKHYEIRAFTTGSVFNNFHALWREISGGRYRSYSWGRFAAIKDLFRILYSLIQRGTA